MWHGYNKRLFCKPHFLGDFNTSGPVHTGAFRVVSWESCLSRSVRTVLHLLSRPGSGNADSGTCCQVDHPPVGSGWRTGAEAFSCSPWAARRLTQSCWSRLLPERVNARGEVNTGHRQCCLQPLSVPAFLLVFGLQKGPGHNPCSD